MLALQPKLTEKEQIYALLSHQAGVTVTEADVIVKSTTATTTTDDNGNFIDHVELEFVPGSKVLQANDGVTTASTTYTCVKLANLYAAMGLDPTPVVYVDTAEQLALFDSGTFPAEGYDIFEKSLGIKITADNVKFWAIDNYHSGDKNKFIVAYLDLTHFAFRGTGLSVRIELDTRIAFSSVFNSTPLDGYDVPTQVKTLEGDSSLLPDSDETVSE